MAADWWTQGPAPTPFDLSQWELSLAAPTMWDDVLLQKAQRDQDREAMVVYIARRFGRRPEEVLRLSQMDFARLAEKLASEMPALEAHLRVEACGEGHSVEE